MLNDVSPPPIRSRRLRSDVEDPLSHATLYDHPNIPHVEPTSFWLSLVLFSAAATMALAVWLWTR